MEIKRIEGYNGTPKVECLNPYLQKYLIRWDFEEKENDLVEYNEIEYYCKPSIEAIKKLIIDFYNDQCNNEILQGLTFEGDTVWLSQENQFNYKSAFDYAIQTDGLNLPCKFKFGSDDEPVYRQFNNVIELRDFITIVMTHITFTLEKYWTKKDSINWNDYEI